MTRRQLLQTLVAAPAALWAVTRAKAKPQPTAPAVSVASPLPQPAYTLEGLAIKVPSNRTPYWNGPSLYDTDQRGYGWTHRYVGDWDGTVKPVRGCANPAYILADLYERTGAEPDWAVGRPITSIDQHGVAAHHGYDLDWQMLYHWGVWCDELVWEDIETCPLTFKWGCKQPDNVRLQPRFAVNTFCQTHDDMVQLRETLRMHYLSWQSEDPRYRTSWPGIPYLYRERRMSHPNEGQV